MNSKTTALIMISAVVLVGIYFTMFGSKEGSSLTNFSSQNGKVVVAFGDSLSRQDGQSVLTFPNYLSKLTNSDVQDLTVAGETTVSAIARLETATALNPNYVLLTLGTEDLNKQIDLKETIDNLATIFSSLQATGAAVVYLSVVPPMVGDNWEMAVKDVVKAHGVLWVDDIMVDVWDKPELLNEILLPNDKGHEVIAARIQDVLAKHTDLY